MAGFKYKYSIRFLNNEGNWQEKHAVKTMEEAEQVRDNLQTSGRTAIIVNLEDEANENIY